MKQTQRLIRIIPAALGLLCGCQVLEPLVETRFHEPGQSISPQQRLRASALALYAQGILHDMNQEHEDALRCFEDALALEPRHEELYFRVAMGHFQARNAEKAILVLEELANAFPDSERALRWLALIYRASGFPVKSADIYDRWIKLAPQNPAPYIQKADLLLKQQDLDGSLKLLEKAVDKTKGDPEPYRALADFYLLQGIAGDDEEHKDRRQKVIQLLETVTEKEPSDTLSLNKLAELYVADHRLEDAIAAYEKLEKQSPSSKRLKERIVQGYLTAGEQEKAIRMLEKMANEDASDPKPYLSTAEIYLQLNDRVKATKAYKRAIESDPKSQQAYIQLSLLNLEGDPETCIEVLKRGLSELPGNPALMEMMAYTHMIGKKDYPEAVAWFEKVIDRVGSKVLGLEPSFYFNYIFALQRSGRIEDAATQLEDLYQENPDFLEVYMRAVVLDPDEESSRASLDILGMLKKNNPSEPRIPYYMGTLYNYLKRYAEAVEAFERSEALIESTGSGEELKGRLFHFWYGAALERVGRLKDAESQFLKSVELDPEFADAYNYLAYMWIERESHLEKAAGYIEQALELEPESGAFIDTLGWLHFMRGEYEEALVQIERALEYLPGDPTILDHHGEVLLQLGRPEEAVEAWIRSLRIQDSPGIRKKVEAQGVDVDAELKKKPVPHMEEPVPED